MKVYELLDSPEKWTTGFMARDINNVPVKASSKNAVCWCTIGAIIKCYDPLDSLSVLNKIKMEVNLDTRYTIGLWNDNTTWQVVYNLTKN